MLNNCGGGWWVHSVMLTRTHDGDRAEVESMEVLRVVDLDKVCLRASTMKILPRTHMAALSGGGGGGGGCLAA